MLNTNVRRKRWLWMAVAVVVVLGIALFVSLGGYALERRWTHEEVIEAFRAANLEVTDPEEMSDADFGPAPQLATRATRFYVWNAKLCSCSQEPKGYILIFDNPRDLEATRAYYEDIAGESIFFERPLYVRGSILFMMSADVPPDIAEQYGQVLADMR